MPRLKVRDVRLVVSALEGTPRLAFQLAPEEAGGAVAAEAAGQEHVLEDVVIAVVIITVEERVIYLSIFFYGISFLLFFTGRYILRPWFFMFTLIFVFRIIFNIRRVYWVEWS